MTEETWAWLLFGALLALLGGGWIYLETVVKRRFLRRMWDQDRLEWFVCFGKTDDFEKHRGPRP